MGVTRPKQCQDNDGLSAKIPQQGDSTKLEQHGGQESELGLGIVENATD